MSRHVAREHLFQLTFEFIFSNEKNEQTLNAYLMDATLCDEDKRYMVKAYDGITAHFDELKSIVAQFADGYNADRIYKPDLAAMILCAYELKYEDDIPAAVSINEAVDLVKKFSTEKSKTFVNGVLASVNKYLSENK
ncbi:MAG: transcription antitermination factor NusB [Eubacteriales bacterium]|nr:transcription antitermination factor NusB [Christensenellaceae bacterium]MDY2751345.1 transcription antitermination factor NusB [Eubacteriales bacterium]